MADETISHFKILEKLGEGGMGVVYKAEDTRLRRTVALKFISRNILGTEEAAARFIREARTAASISHPNVCTIHEVSEVSPGDEIVLPGGRRLSVGTPYIVMEFVDGRSMKSYVEKGGPLPLRQLVSLAAQMASGLACAHSEGVVHRDLKPGNVMITKDNRAKILDFGLAKPLEHEPGTETATAVTREGILLGTAAYMSPEQARGEALDARSDVFSLGAMLFEMATGHRPFRGSTTAAILVKIAKSDPEPPLALARPDLPSELQHIIERCLRKEPDDRFNDTRDLMVSLRDLSSEYPSWSLRRPGNRRVERTSPRDRPSRVGIPRPLLVSLALTLVAVSVFSVAVVVRRSPSRHQVAAAEHQQLTFCGEVVSFALSPCGEYAAYIVAEGEVGRFAVEGRLMVRDIAGHQPTEVFRGRLYREIEWTHDGTGILLTASFPEGWASRIMPRSGGPSLRIEPLGNHYDSSPDGERIASSLLSQKTILIYSRAAHDSAPVKRIDLAGEFEWLLDVEWSPHANVIAFSTLDAGQSSFTIRTVTLDGRHESIVARGSQGTSPCFSSEGEWLYYVRERGGKNEICRVPVDPETGRRRGDEVVVLTGSDFTDISISRDGRRLLYGDWLGGPHELWRLPLEAARLGDGVDAERLIVGRPSIWSPRCSPDGQLIGFCSASGGGSDLFLMRADGTNVQQLTSLGSVLGRKHSIAWSPDATELAFMAPVEDEMRVWTVSIVSGAARPLPGTSASGQLAWAPGESIVYQTAGNRNFRFVSPEGTPGPTLVPVGSPGWMFLPRYSPDGDKVAVTWNRREGLGLWVVSLIDSSYSMVAPVGLDPIRWSSDARWIYAWDHRRDDLVVFRVPAAGGDPEPICSAELEGVEQVELSPDATTIYYTTRTATQDIWLVEDFDVELASN